MTVTPAGPAVPVRHDDADCLSKSQQLDRPGYPRQQPDGGRIEIGETPEECVSREIFEETQWTVTTGPILDTWMYSIDAAVEPRTASTSYGHLWQGSKRGPPTDSSIVILSDCWAGHECRSASRSAPSFRRRSSRRPPGGPVKREVLLAIGNRADAEQSLLAALAGAETYRLPHQIQRALRLAEDQLGTVAEIGRSALERLDRQLASPLWQLGVAARACPAKTLVGG